MSVPETQSLPTHARAGFSFWRTSAPPTLSRSQKGHTNLRQGCCNWNPLILSPARSGVFFGGATRHATGGLSAWSPALRPRARERLDARLCQPSRVETIGVGARLRHLDETAAREHLCRSWRAAVAASVELDRPQHVPHRGGHLREIAHLFRC